MTVSLRKSLGFVSSLRRFYGASYEPIAVTELPPCPLSECESWAEVEAHE